MGKLVWTTHGFRLRDLVLVLTLSSHLMVTFGFPLPAPRRKSKGDSVPFPCQSLPCGCITAAECWKGDCCCFTLEDKLRWAEENGIEPPEHVRPLVESRKTRPTPPKPKKKPCCSEAEPAPELSAPATPACCEKHKPATSPCCEESQPPASTHVAESVSDCPHCAAKSQSNCCEKDKKPTPADQSDVRWVVGIFAQKCRGDRPAGLFQHDPAVVPDLALVVLTEPERSGHTAPRSDRTTSTTHTPPARPPRSS